VDVIRVSEPLTLPEAMRLAERMYDRGRGGWSIQGIQQYLARRGIERSWRTVKRWADPEFAEQDRRRLRQLGRTKWGQRTDGRVGRQDHSPDFRVARMVALHHEAQLPLSAIARIMSFDYGVAITRTMAERAIVDGRVPPPYLAESGTGVDGA
jgi:hypothetical protein